MKKNPRGATASARAHSNIALVKYWGKRDPVLNIPAVGSISVTLDGLYTDTTVTFCPDLHQDTFELDGREEAAARVGGILDLVRRRAGIGYRARVSSVNNFPTAAGLASSASGFAALALAASKAAGLDLDDDGLGILARRGSGSAARSIFGGFVEMKAGTADDGSDAVARQLLRAADWPLEVIVAITDAGIKPVDSTSGMIETAESSLFYDAWVAGSESDLAEARGAIESRDFETLGQVTEHSCLKMHALMLTSRPALLYWNAATLAAMHAVRTLRDEGLPVYFTIDAGPQVKAICLPHVAGIVAAALANVEGVREVRRSRLGRGAQLME